MTQQAAVQGTQHTLRWVQIAVLCPCVRDYEPTRVPLGLTRYVREYNADGVAGSQLVDICLSRAVDIGRRLVIEIDIRADGSIHWCGTIPGGGDNTYWQFSRIRSTEISDLDPPTEAQRRTLALMYLHQAAPFGLAALGRPVLEWAFAGITPDELSARYGDGSPVHLA